jgi:hypothetical protein
MNTYQSKYWQVDLPAEWQAEQEDDAVILYHSKHDGSLLISALQEDDTISDEYLADLVDEHIAADAELEQVEFGPFDGLSVCYESEGEYWCEWYLRARHVLLFITYNCPLAQEGSEDDVVESILESLQLRSDSQLH